MCPVHGQPYHDKARLLVNNLTLQRNAEITPLFNDEEGINNALVRIQGHKDYLNGQLVGYGMAWVKPVQCKARMCDEWKSSRNWPGKTSSDFGLSYTQCRLGSGKGTKNGNISPRSGIA